MDKRKRRRRELDLCMHKCDPPGACVGGQDPKAYCRKGHFGTMCGSCDSSYFKSADGLCYACENARWNKILFYILPALLLLMMLLLCYCIYKFYERVHQHIERGQVQKIRKSVLMMRSGMRFKNQAGNLIPRLKILVSMLQVQVGVIPTFSIRLPDVFTQFISVFNVWDVNLPIDCFFRVNYHTRLVYQTLGPILIALGVFIVYRCFKLYGRVSDRAHNSERLREERRPHERERFHADRGVGRC